MRSVFCGEHGLQRLLVSPVRDLNRVTAAPISCGAHQQSVRERDQVDVVALLAHRLHIARAELLHGDALVAQALRITSRPFGC